MCNNIAKKSVVMVMKKTVVLGASKNPSRYSNLAMGMLDEAGHEFVPLGIKKGEILGKTILNIKDKPLIEDVDTVTIYLNASNQKGWYDYILGLHPKRLIFNPGTENSEFQKLAKAQGIKVENACTLVLIRSGQY